MNREFFCVKVQLASSPKEAPEWVTIFLDQVVGFAHKDNKLLLQNGEAIAITNSWDSIKKQYATYGVIKEIS